MTDFRIVGVLLAIFLIGLGGWKIRDYKADQQITALNLEAERAKTAELSEYIGRLAALEKTNQDLQNKLSDMDTKHTGKLNEKIDENNRLRTDLATAQRMRLKGTSCPQTNTGSDHTASTGLDDGAGIELSAETRLAVWDLRESIIRDQAKLAYLQEERRSLTCTVQE